MLNRKISIIVGSLLIVVVGLLVYAAAANKRASFKAPSDTGLNPATSTLQAKDNTGGTKITPKKPAPAPTPTPAPTGITLNQVASHNSRTSCWSAINGNVYDLTSWIPNHPGGEGAILSLCGIDGTSLYQGQHGSARRPLAILAGFKIAPLAQ